MDHSVYRKNEGLKKKIRAGKRLFRTPENVNHYSDKQYKLAEKMFIKRCILEDQCALSM